MHFTIIGAGIGGLTTAIALLKKGFTVSIFEAAEELKPIGAGIILANNAMQVYQKLGLEKDIQKRGQHIAKLSIADPQIRPLSTIQLAYFEKKHQTYTTGIHRGQLQRILLEHLPGADIFTGKKMLQLKRADHQIDLSFADGSHHRTDYLIAADGIHSAVRKHLFPKSKIRSAKQACWRGVVEMEFPDRYRHEVFECWGKGERFGIVPIGDRTLYWFALQDYQGDVQEEFADFDLQQLGTNFHPFLQQVLRATPPENIFVDDITDLEPLPYWHSENICLLGDAAHATTPNMGQGAGQAIEDAWALAELLAINRSPEKAFKAFELFRRKKVNQIVGMSWTIGKMAHWKNSIAVGLRNIILKWTPASIGNKQSEQVFDLGEIDL